MQNLTTAACGLNPRINKDELVRLLESITNRRNLGRFTKQQLCLAMLWARATELGVPRQPLNPDLLPVAQDLVGKSSLVEALVQQEQRASAQRKDTPFRKRRRAQDILEHPDLRKPALQRFFAQFAPYLADQELPPGQITRIDPGLALVTFAQGFLRGILLNDPERFGRATEILDALTEDQFGKVWFAGPVPDSEDLFLILYESLDEDPSIMSVGQVYQLAQRGEFAPLEYLVERLGKLHCSFLLRQVAMPLIYGDTYGLRGNQLVLRHLWPPLEDLEEHHREDWYQENQIEKFLDFAEMEAGGVSLPDPLLRDLKASYLMELEKCRF